MDQNEAQQKEREHELTKEIELEKKPRLPDAPALLDQTISTYRSRFWDIAFVCLVLFLSSTLQDIALSTNIRTLIVVVTILNLIISILSVLAFMVAIAHPETVIRSGSALYDQAIGLVIPYLWIIIVIGLALIGGAVLFVIPALVLSIFLNFANYTLVVENRRGLDALIASWHYIEGRWWSVAWRTIFFGALVFILSLVVNFIIFLLSSSVTAATIATYQPPLSGSIVADAWSAFIIVPASIIYFYHLFLNLKIVNPTPPNEAQKRSIKNWVMSFVILGIVVLFLGLAFATLSISKYLPEFLRAAPMTASVIYAPFLH